MYQILGIAKYLRYFGLAAAIAAAAIVAFTDVPTSGTFRIASAVVGGLLLLIFMLGETPAFPWLCKRMPLSFLFPDIDGVWRVELESNWPIIAKLEGIEIGVQAPADKKLSGTITIKARLFSVHMKLDMDNKYSKSRTLFVKVEKDAGGTVNLHYVYENTTLKPVETDSGSHFGAASLELTNSSDGEVVLEGPYWTNRNWERARNTAGLITLRR